MRRVITGRKKGPFPFPLLLLACDAAVAAELFVDATASARIRFEHRNGFGKGKRHLFETMSGGAGWLDFDGDGLLDLYIVQSHSDVDNAAGAGPERNVLWRNRGDGTFEEVAERAGLGDRRYGNGVAVGDVDSDGDTDLYVTNFGRNTLYLNNGDGTFRDATEDSAVAVPGWSMSACFVDLDGDAILDLYVTNYLAYDTRVHKGCTGNRLKKPDYCHPNKFRGAADALFRGRGGGRFEDVSAQVGVQVASLFTGKGLGVLPTDYDQDGDVDLIVACDSVPNLVWRNLGGFRFEDVALEVGIALSSEGKALAGMGIDGGDVNGDGHFDYTITNFAKESNTLFLGDPSGFFFEGSAVAGIAGPTFLPLAFGTKLLDFDRDGDLDIYVACGHVSHLVEELYPRGKEKLEQPDLLFENDGKGAFTEISATAGAWFQREHLGRGAAFADYDNDGDLDAFVVNCHGPGVLLENRSSNANHWVGLELEGDGRRVNRDGYGALVTVTSGAGVRRKFEVRSAASYLSANDPRVLCGLGKESTVRQVEIRWPDGTVEVFDKLRADSYQKLAYGQGKK